MGECDDGIKLNRVQIRQRILRSQTTGHACIKPSIQPPLLSRSLPDIALRRYLTVTLTNVWTRLNIMWISFFIVMGLVNLYVAFHFETNTWVNFKLFGMMGLTLVFVFIQGVYLAYHIAPEAEKKPTESHTHDA